jgi:CheY-like chemotaxis protein
MTAKTSSSTHTGTGAPHACDSGPGPAVACAQRSLRILVVDDLVDAADSLALLLRMLGHQVKTAHDGPAALEAAEQFQPEAVVLDIALPKLDGYQVAMRLRQDPQLQKVCLIALSGYGEQSDVERGAQAGFDYHWLKPVDLDKLESVIAELANRSS